MPGGWRGSDRAERLPADWPLLRMTVLQRDGHTCQLQMDGCTTVATEADHIHRGDDHAPTNLQAACAWCHSRKTSAEGNAARTRYSTKRPSERHPGLL